MIDLLAKPITDLLGAFGSGVVPVGGPADVLRTTSIALESLQRVGGAAVSELAATWSGRAAEQAIGHAEQAHTSAIGLADHGSDMAAVVDRACEKVYAGLVELQAIAQSFISIATAAAPMIFTPPGQSMLIAAAIEHLQRALAVVARVRAPRTRVPRPRPPGGGARDARDELRHGRHRPDRARIGTAVPAAAHELARSGADARCGG